MQIGAKVKPFGAKRCSCAEAKTYWLERDEKMRLENELRTESERRLRLDKLFAQSLIPSRWRQRTFETFEAMQENKEAYEIARQYADNFTRDTKHGLIMSGKVGRGKTHLCAATSLELLGRGHSVVFGTVTNLLSQIKNTFSGDRETEQSVFNRFTRCQLLVIDDLGKEKVTDWVEQTLYEIVNSRYESNRPILVTTNMDVFGLPKRYPNSGEAILSRVLEMCKGIQVGGTDWRIKGMQDG